MKKTLLELLTIGLLLLITACSTPKANSPSAFTPCKEPRSTFCTREYRPVCAKLGKFLKEKTYSNACTACADDYVTGFSPGSCSE